MQKTLNLIFHKKVFLNRSTAPLLIALVILLIHNFSFAIDRFAKLVAENSNSFSFYKFFFEFGLHSFLIFAFLFFCSFNKILFRTAAFILFLLSTIFAFIYNKFGVVIDHTSISNALDNRLEAENLISFSSLAIYLFFLLILPFIIVCRFEILETNNKKNLTVIAAISIFLVTILASFDHEERRGAIVFYAPISLIDSLNEYFGDIHSSLKNKKILKPITEVIPDAKANRKKIEDIKVILIIGESARSKNFSINGYDRETTPQLEKIKNLLSFKDVTPCWNLTSYSVSCMLSRKTSKQFSFVEDSEESIVKLFEKLGFTTAWFSTQKAVGDDSILLLLAAQAQKYFFGNSVSKRIGSNRIYDEYLLNFLSDEINNNKDNFVILHTQGSHFLFDERSPKEFKKFTPVCSKKNPKDCSAEEVINAYDNSIFYTDYFIASVIERLKNQNAILFYVSDHGQFLGEGGVYYHGNKGSFNQPEHRVPMFLWMSDSLLKNQFYRQKFAVARSKIAAPLSHDNLFDSLLDCSGIDSKFFDRGLSLCKK